jgi:hypothetical protein
MPIEIRELVIKATVSDTAVSNDSQLKLSEQERKEIIQACISEMMKQLAKNKKR